MKFELPKLAYAYEALEPVIDAKTMEIHHSKHHQGYVDKLNAAIEKHKDLQEMALSQLIETWEELPGDVRTAVRNNGGGHFNHSLFWEVMGPKKNLEPKGKLREAMDKTFGGLTQFKEKFTQAAVTQFGSGWAWLTVDKKGELYVFQSANQDSPVMKGAVGCKCVDCQGECEGECGTAPILNLDVWEHAYYLKYQNRRAEYVENWWQVVNWGKVEEKYNQVIA